MSNLGYNILVLAFCWLLATGTGVYITFFRQPEELERVKKAEQVARMKQAEVTSLLAEESGLREQAKEVVSKWNTRYKVIPPELTSPEVIGYLNGLTQSGFETFNVAYGGNFVTKDFSYYSFSITGRGYFTSLYEVIWELENNRHFYRIHDLNLDHIDLTTEDPETGREELKVLVSFRLELDAYYNGADGISAPASMFEGRYEDDQLPTGQMAELPPVPADVLPDARPDVNPFYPLIMENIPPNTDNLLDLDQARLVSIVGQQAVFQSGGEFVSVGVGDAIYLGQITTIDPTADRVVARLNKGGIIDEVEMTLDAGERFRQASGPNRLAPAGND